eukprot:gene7927-biopygen17683
MSPISDLSHPNGHAFYVTLLMHYGNQRTAWKLQLLSPPVNTTMYRGMLTYSTALIPTSSDPQPVNDMRTTTSSRRSWMMSTGDQSRGPGASSSPSVHFLALSQCTWTLPLQRHSAWPPTRRPYCCLSHMDPNYLQEGGLTTVCQTEQSHPMQIEGPYIQTVTSSSDHHRDGTEAQRKEMAAMLNRITPAVARTMEDLREGYKGIVPPMHIEKDNDKQAFTSPYRKPPIEKLAQDKVCAELLLLGFIEPAPFAQHAANPVVALKKGPGGQYTANRVCYNYKAINLLTKDMHTCFPIAEELFQDLGDSKWFTRVDLRSSFYQVHLSVGCQDFSAFWWDKQLYRFKRVPFGLKQAPAYFQKVMETELGKRGLLKFSKVFIDDILVHSAAFADHIKDVEAVLQCLIDIGLRIHPDKSCFALDAVDFLGFDVSNHGLTPQAAKVQAIKDLPYPSNLKDLKTILGAQHGNADALSRFPSPTAEDNTGARIDLDSDLYAAFPTVPTTPYVPLDLTLGHIVDHVLDVRSVLSICTTPLPAAVTYMAQNGITLYEMCGGMCAGLEAALRNGHPTPSPPLAPGRQLDTDLRLAAMSKDTDGLDIHSDQFVLEYLRRGVLGSNWTISRTRRVLARSRKYRLGASPTGEERIIRILANGIERIVPAPSQRGNTMLMHAVEYFSAALAVVPIPAKEAIHTVYAHSHGVLAHFGAYALCISDNGPEFQGKFKEHLLHNFIDHRTIHPNHPQGNGFVERSVGTIKAALTKICSDNLATDTWDIDIAKMAAQGMILRIIDLKPSEVVVLQGRCVPVEDWFCPNCKASGITEIPAGRIPEAPQKEPNLFPTPQTRSRDRAALACDKMLVIKQIRVQGGLDKAVWGTASFQGPLSRPCDTMANHPSQMIYSVLAHATMVTSITPKAMSFDSPLNLSNSTLHAFTSSKLPGTTSKLT